MSRFRSSLGEECQGLDQAMERNVKVFHTSALFFNVLPLPIYYLSEGFKALLESLWSQYWLNHHLGAKKLLM